MRLAILGVAILLILGALAWLAIAAFHFWMSSGPPIPQPRDAFATRALIDLAVAAALAIAAGATLWLRARMGIRETSQP
jgi:hypothetical protein